MALRPFARIRMAALTSSYLAAYRDERLKVVSGATVNREFNVLSHAIDTARREWEIHIPFNPALWFAGHRRGAHGAAGCRAMRNSACSRSVWLLATPGSRIS
jgi:hypothetical protein